MRKSCNPNHPLLRNRHGPLKRRPKDGLPRPGERARVLHSLLEDGEWHSDEECYDYVKARCTQKTLNPTHFGQGLLNRYFEVCITDDDMVRLGKPRP